MREDLGVRLAGPGYNCLRLGVPWAEIFFLVTTALAVLISISESISDSTAILSRNGGSELLLDIASRGGGSSSSEEDRSRMLV